MRDLVRAMVELAAPALELRGPVFEFGSLLVEGQEFQANLRNIFPGQPYCGCDMRPGPGVDRVEDLAQLNLPDGSARTILCLETLEHVFEARRGVEEMLRVLAPGGVIVLSTPLDFRLHNYPDDYWRLTPTCMDRLLAPLAATVIGSVGIEKFPHTVFAIGAKAPVPSGFTAGVNRLLEEYQLWLTGEQARQRRRQWWRWALTSWAWRKGERRKWREQFEARFWLRMPSGTSLTDLARGALPVGRGRSRIDH